MLIRGVTQGSNLFHGMVYLRAPDCHQCLWGIAVTHLSSTPVFLWYSLSGWVNYCKYPIGSCTKYPHICLLWLDIEHKWQHDFSKKLSLSISYKYCSDNETRASAAAKLTPNLVIIVMFVIGSFHCYDMAGFTKKHSPQPENITNNCNIIWTEIITWIS